MTDLSTRYLGWCPVCERDIKVRDDHLVHHGYQRPGVGYIVGDCFGVGYEPYELSTTCCKAFLSLVRNRVDMYTDNLRVLESPDGPEYLYFKHYDIETRKHIRDRTGEAVTIKLTHDAADALAAQLPSYEAYRYSWEDVLRSSIVQTRGLLDSWTKEQRRMEQLIAEWRKQPLRTFEEEIQRQEQTRAERDAARNVARDAKIMAEVVKIRKRIDSAVRNKNSSVLADIFTSTKLREVSGYRLSQDQALELLERDAIWRAFGLLTPSGYLAPGGLMSADPARELLEEMRWGRKVPANHPGVRFDYAPFPWPAELGGGVAKTR